MFDLHFVNSIHFFFFIYLMNHPHNFEARPYWVLSQVLFQSDFVENFAKHQPTLEPAMLIRCAFQPWNMMPIVRA